MVFDSRQESYGFLGGLPSDFVDEPIKAQVGQTWLGLLTRLRPNVLSISELTFLLVYRGALAMKLVKRQLEKMQRKDFVGFYFCYVKETDWEVF